MTDLSLSCTCGKLKGKLVNLKQCNLPFAIWLHGQLQVTPKILSRERRDELRSALKS